MKFPPSKYVCISSGKLHFDDLLLNLSGNIVGTSVAEEVLSSISLNFDDWSNNPRADDVVLVNVFDWGVTLVSTELCWLCGWELWTCSSACWWWSLGETFWMIELKLGLGLGLGIEIGALEVWEEGGCSWRGSRTRSIDRSPFPRGDRGFSRRRTRFPFFVMPRSPLSSSPQGASSMSTLLSHGTHHTQLSMLFLLGCSVEFVGFIAFLFVLGFLELISFSRSFLISSLLRFLIYWMLVACTIYSFREYWVFWIVFRA